MSASRVLCPRFHKAVELIGGRWTGAIIQILLPGHARFTELRAAIPDISDRMLSERLRELEAEGLIARSVIPEIPVRVEYALTKKGRALQDALDALVKWAENWVTAEEVEKPKRQPARGGERSRRTESARTARRPVTELRRLR